MMEAVFNFELKQPLWLMLIVLLPAILLLLSKRSQQNNTLQNYFSPKILKQIIVGPKHSNKTTRWLITLIWLLICVALSGPYIKGTIQENEILPGANVAIIIDISPSMSVADVSPNRIGLGKLQLNSFVQELEQTRLSLTAFSANAYAILPLTGDKKTFIHFANALDPKLVTVAGSNLSGALEIARESLNEESLSTNRIPSGIAILISDGEIHDAEAWNEAEKFTQQGHRLYTVGVGSEEGGPVPLMLGQLVRQNGELLTSTRQRESLKSLSQLGGGDYFDIAPESWEQLKQIINRLEKTQYQHTTSDKQGTALFPWLISAATILILSYGWKRVDILTAILIAPALLLSQTTEANPWTEQQAFNALNKGEYVEAQSLYRQIEGYAGYLGIGVSLYRMGHWKEAEAAFQKALTLAETTKDKERIVYNLGNCQTQQGRLDEAIKSYELTLSLNPLHKSAIHNLALLKHQRHLSNKGEPQDQNKSKTGQQGKEINVLGTSQEPDHASPLNTGETGNKRSQQEQSQSTSNKQQLDNKTRLQNSIKEWGQLDEKKGAAPTHVLQQLHNLKDDTTTMLRRRFSIEDERAIGLIEEKPW